MSKPAVLLFPRRYTRSSPFRRGDERWIWIWCALCL